jgi:hypothetical protein
MGGPQVTRPGKVLHLYSAMCLDHLTKTYGEKLYLGGRDNFPNWERVARDYDGVIISPYQFNRRMTLMWYYPWDCASGCIWRPTRVVQQVGPAEPVDWAAEQEQSNEED